MPCNKAAQPCVCAWQGRGKIERAQREIMNTRRDREGGEIEREERNLLVHISAHTAKACLAEFGLAPQPRLAWLARPCPTAKAYLACNDAT